MSVAMIATLLAGCGGKSEGTAAPAEEKKEEAAPAEEKKEEAAPAEEKKEEASTETAGGNYKFEIIVKSYQ